MPAVVAERWRLYLYNVCAHVGQKHGAHRPGEDSGQVNNENIVERFDIGRLHVFFYETSSVVPRKPINFLDLVQRLSRKIVQNADDDETHGHMSVISARHA